MCRRCCCRDVYYFNADTIDNQFRTRAFSQEPVIRHQLNSQNVNGRFAIDYRNQRTFGTRSIRSVPQLWTTNDLQWERPRTIGSLSADSSGTVSALACDSARQKLYYISEENTTPVWQVRSINYDGTGDTQVIDEPVLPSTTGGMNVGASLNYDPGGDRLYYWRQYTTSVAGVLTRKYEIRSVKPDGSDPQTVSTFVTYGPAASLPQSLIFSTGHFALPRFVVSLLYTPNGADFTQYNTLTLFDVASGARTDILSSHNLLDGVTPFRRFISPVYCYADGKIYFGSQNFNNPAGQPAYNFVTYNRCNLDGSGEEVIFSFRDNQPPNDNPFNWAATSDGQTGVLFRLGCGFENVGDKYGGVG